MNVFNKLLYDLIKYRATVHLIPVQEGLAKIDYSEYKKEWTIHYNVHSFDVLVENERMKQLLREMLPDMEARAKGFKECYPGKEVLAALTRTEDFVRRINEFTKEF